jgi:hypothetical protein
MVLSDTWAQGDHFLPLSQIMNQVIGIGRGVLAFDEWCRHDGYDMDALAEFLAACIHVPRRGCRR